MALCGLHVACVRLNYLGDLGTRLYLRFFFSFLFFLLTLGLDPASLYFTNVNNDARLDRSDARYVDVIHTDAGFFGTSKKGGHSDFFPNGGSRQPGCVFKIHSKSGSK